MWSEANCKFLFSKTSVKCENKTPWDARTIHNKQLHAALSAEKSLDNPIPLLNVILKEKCVKKWLP